MAHAQKPDFVFPRNGRVHSNRWGRQFSRLLVAEVCASALVMLDTPRSDVAWEYWLPTPFASFPFTFPPVRHRVPPGSERSLLLRVHQFSSLVNSHARTTHGSAHSHYYWLLLQQYAILLVSSKELTGAMRTKGDRLPSPSPSIFTPLSGNTSSSLRP